MALFTLDNASRNPLKYEQLNSEETVTAASSLPTSAAAQMATGSERGALQGSIVQAASTTPLRTTMGSMADSSGAGFNAAAANTGSYGAQADNQSFSGVAGTFAPGGNSLSESNTSSGAYYGGDIAQSSSSNSTAEVGNIAHSLKSSSRQMGALKLGEAAYRVEQAARANPPDPYLPQFVQSLQSLMPATVQAVNEQLQSHPQN